MQIDINHGSLIFARSGVDKLQREVQAIVDELIGAMVKFNKMASPHEGLAVIEEEVDELKREVRDNKREVGIYLHDMQVEARHSAAMSLRFLLDVC